MLPLILLSQIAVSVAATTCDLTQIAVANGEYTLTDGTEVGSLLEYTCPKGKYPYPPSSQECLSDGTWSNSKTKFQCRVVQCPRPVIFENGECNPRKGKYFVGDVLYFECWGGFRMFGPENRTCQENGKWSGEETKCDNQEGDCPNPGIPIGSTKVGTSYKIENRVRYECQDDLKMFGSKERVCQENKHWSGAEPSCRYWYTFDTPEEVTETFSSTLSEAVESSDPDKVEEDGDRTIRVETAGLMNIFIVIDASKSVGPKNFKTAKEISEVFIDKMASFDFTPCYAVISYASFAKTIVGLSDKECTDADQVIERIKAFRYSAHEDKQGTNTRAALNEVHKMMSLEHVRNPKKFLDTRNVILLMTDGKHNMGGDPNEEMKRIRELMDISRDKKREDFLDVYVFGLGKDISENEINEIASKKDKENHVFKMKSIDDMKRAFDDMLEESQILQMCGLSRPPVPSKDDDFDDDDDKNKKDKGEIYPWIAKIIITRPGSQEKCKGSILSKFSILTAAHCFHLDESLSAISVEVGGRTYGVKNLHRHRDYNPGGKRDKNVTKSFDYDLALLEIKGTIDFSRKIRPICLPCTTGTSWALKQRGKSVTCSDHEKTLLSSELVKAMFVAEEKDKELERKDVTIKQGNKRLGCLDDTKKIEAFINVTNMKDLITDNFLCTGGIEPQVDPQTCKGDSGGPLIVQFKQRFIQVGIISWGNINSCNGPVRSRDPVPKLSRDFHTHLFHMMNWLKDKLKDELEFLG